jgi:predicted phage terminase large subunit-like protein
MSKLVLGLDLSGGIKETHDYTAFVLGGYAIDKDDRPQFYIIDAVQVRAMGNLEKMDAIKDIWMMWRHLVHRENSYLPMEIFVESNGYQISFQCDFKFFVEQNKIYDWIIKPASIKGDKLQRLRGHSGLFYNRVVFFNRYARHLESLIQQLLEFGSVAHDDLMDAMVICLSGLRGTTNNELSFFFE